MWKGWILYWTIDKRWHFSIAVLTETLYICKEINIRISIDLYHTHDSAFICLHHMGIGKTQDIASFRLILKTGKQSRSSGKLCTLAGEN